MISGPVEHDWPYIRSTWLRSYRESDSCAGMPDTAYFPWQRARIARVLDRAPLVLVARDEDSPIYVLGYGVFERIGSRFVTHWVYVRKAEKRQGIGRLLLATALAAIGQGASKLVMTHRTYFEAKAREMGFEFQKLESLYAELEAQQCGL